jgi:hypothetical protein
MANVTVASSSSYISSVKYDSKDFPIPRVGEFFYMVTKSKHNEVSLRHEVICVEYDITLDSVSIEVAEIL